jgi:hypothetical protein
MIQKLISSRGMKFFFSVMSRLAVGPSQVPLQGQPLPEGSAGWFVRLVIHLHPMPRLRMIQAIPLLLQHIFIAGMGTLLLLN